MPGRNSPCHCGSGKKYKLCHGAPANIKVSLPDPARLLNKATHLARTGGLDEALVLAAQLPASPVKYQFQIDLLKSRNRQGDLQLAEKICTQWCKTDSVSVQPLFQLMQLHWKSGRVDMTPSLALKIGKLDPGHRLTPYYQAVSQQLNGCHGQALIGLPVSNAAIPRQSTTSDPTDSSDHLDHVGAPTPTSPLRTGSSPAFAQWVFSLLSGN